MARNRHSGLIVLALTAWLSATGSAAATGSSLDAAAVALDAGQVGVAHTAYLDRARKGDAEAQYMLGRLYAERLEVNWRGEPHNALTAVQWLTQAGNRGHADAMRMLIAMYGNGQGIAQDADKAKLWQAALVRRLTPPPEKPKPDPSAYRVELVDRDNAIMTIGPGADLARLSRELKQMLEMRRNLPPIRSN